MLCKANLALLLVSDDKQCVGGVMSKRQAIYKLNFVYDGEWYVFEPNKQSLYQIIDSNMDANDIWAGLERDALADYDFESLRVFADGEYSDEQYQEIYDFVTKTCKLPLAAEEDGFYYPEDIPVEEMSSEQLLSLLKLAGINHYIVKDYVPNEPRSVIYNKDNGYLTSDPSGYSEQIWSTNLHEDALNQYQKDIQDETILNQISDADLKKISVQELLEKYEAVCVEEHQQGIAVIDFSEASDEAFMAFSEQLEQPIYLVQRVNDAQFCKINQNPTELHSSLKKLS